MCKCELLQNQVFYSFTFTEKNLSENLTRFHGGLFELGILEIFTTAFLLKTFFLNLTFVQVLQSALLKSETKNLLKKDAIYPKNSKNNNDFFFTFIFLCKKVDILLEKIFAKV